MSITVVTGLPGSGKTLLTIDKLLRPLIGAVEKRVDHDDQVHLVHRKIYTNIDRLVLDHELIEAGPVWELHGKEWKQAEGNRHGLHNWQEWAEPGAVIIWDEAQDPWPPRPNGSPNPPDVLMLAKHRHKGVDFIVMTQKPLLLDRFVLEQADRHLHMRRMSTLPLAIVYEWDGVSRSLTYRSALSKRPYRYNRRVFKLYHSADLHTKQRRTLPTVLWGLLLAVVGVSYLAPTAVSSFRAQVGRKATEATSLLPASLRAAGGASAPAQAGITPMPLVPTGPVAWVAASGVPTKNYDFAGCAVMHKVCTCYDTHGQKVVVRLEACEASALPRDVAQRLVGGHVDELPLFQVTTDRADSEIIAWMHRSRPVPARATVGQPSWRPPRDRGVTFPD